MASLYIYKTELLKENGKGKGIGKENFIDRKGQNDEVSGKNRGKGELGMIT